MPKTIGIVGAGVGGLALACRLASKGYSVEVFEKLANCGGRNNILEDSGFKFDMGPSFVLMPDFFEEVFNYCGQGLKKHLSLEPLNINYNIFYPDGTRLTVYKDNDLTRRELEKIEGGASRGYDAFLKTTAKIYQDVRPLLYECFTPKSLLNPRYWGLINKIKALESYWHLAKKYFKSDKLCYAFTFEAMFIGVSPFSAPGFYSIISYADQVQKIYHPMGGMYRIPMALENLGRGFGAKYHYNSEINKIKNSLGRQVLEVNGKDRDFDSVAVNADYPYAQSKLLGQKIPKYKYSCSVYLLYLGLRRKVVGFAHHNLFFARDLRKNLRQIFKEGVIPEDPSFYVHVPTVTDPSLAPGGKEIFYILVPVPNLERAKQDIAAAEARIKKTVFEKINNILGLKVEDLIEVEHKFYPQDFVARYNINYGATFGLAHNLMQSAFFRPANFDPRLKNLYFVGASTQPGGGLPVVIASSRITADLMTR